MAANLEPKPGLSTTEFWVVVVVLAVANVLAVLTAAFSDVDALKVAAACAAALVDTFVTIGYAVVRSSVKKNGIGKGFSDPIVMFFIILVTLFALTICGCSVDEEWVKASRQTYDCIAPEYSKYVKADSTLDKEKKERRLDLLETWLANIEEWEKVVGD